MGNQIVMKKKIYTRSHNPENLREIPSETIFTSDEHSKISELELKDTILENRNKLLEYCLKKNLRTKFQPLSFLVDRIEEKNYSRVLSLGSGLSDLEYFLYLSLDKDKEILSSEFDRYFVEKSNEFFPEFETIEFDFFNDSLDSINKKIDLVFCFGSFYVMDDLQFIRLLKDIKAAGVKEIIDFHAGFMTKSAYLKNIIRPSYSTFKKLFIKEEETCKGKFHGFSRSRNELINLYKKSGWIPVKEINDLGAYKFTCVLNPL